MSSPKRNATAAICAYIDAEHAMDPVYVSAIGVDIDELLISQPDTGEQALEITDMLVRSAAVDVVVIDSVAALTPRVELEGDMGAPHVGLQARLMSQALRKLTGNLHKSDTICIFINQLREKIGVMFGSPETTPGGRALKFYASVRLDIRRIEAIRSGSDMVGNRTRVKVAKNKCAPPFRQAEFDIMYGSGISREGCVLDLAVEDAIVKKSGAWYTYDGEQLGQGRENAKAFLIANPEVTVQIAEGVAPTPRAGRTCSCLERRARPTPARYRPNRPAGSNFAERPQTPARGEGQMDASAANVDGLHRQRTPPPRPASRTSRSTVGTTLGVLSPSVAAADGAQAAAAGTAATILVWLIAVGRLASMGFNTANDPVHCRTDAFRPPRAAGRTWRSSTATRPPQPQSELPALLRQAESMMIDGRPRNRTRSCRQRRSGPRRGRGGAVAALPASAQTSPTPQQRCAPIRGSRLRCWPWAPNRTASLI